VTTRKQEKQSRKKRPGKEIALWVSGNRTRRPQEDPMDFMKSLTVSASGMSVQRTRVGLAASNLANVETTRAEDGSGPYRRLDAVVTPMAFDEALGSAMGIDDGVRGAEVMKVVADPNEGKLVHNPTHPDADANGFVRLPNVNPVQEMVNLMTAQRGYDANATAFETAKTMIQRGLDIVR
jgi:flagellar basal-body rod protein FlgC